MICSIHWVTLFDVYVGWNATNLSLSTRLRMEQAIQACQSQHRPVIFISRSTECIAKWWGTSLQIFLVPDEEVWIFLPMSEADQVPGIRKSHFSLHRRYQAVLSRNGTQAASCRICLQVIFCCRLGQQVGNPKFLGIFQNNNFLLVS